MTQSGKLPVNDPPDWGYCFSYGSLTWYTVYWRADVSALATVLAKFTGGAFQVAQFSDGFGAVSLNPMTYGSHLENMVEATTEAELSILAYPADRASAVPTLGFQEFLMGEEQTKTIGNYRVWVPCDDPFAVAAGKSQFGENKFVTTLPYSFPGPNSPATAWRFKACDPPPTGQAPKTGTNYGDPCDPSDPGNYIFDLSVDVSGLVPVAATNTPVIDYSMRLENPGDPVNHGPVRPSGSVRNILGPFHTYYNAAGLGGVSLSTGTSPHPMTQDVATLIGSNTPVAVQIFQSASPVLESRPFWADQG